MINFHEQFSPKIRLSPDALHVRACAVKRIPERSKRQISQTQRPQSTPVSIPPTPPPSNVPHLTHDGIQKFPQHLTANHKDESRRSAWFFLSRVIEVSRWFSMTQLFKKNFYVSFIFCNVTHAKYTRSQKVETIANVFGGWNIGKL